MKIIYTKHAEQRLRLRNITKTKVNLTIKDCDYQEKGKSNTVVYYRDFGKNYLKIITEEIKEKIIIITLYWVDATRIKFKKVIKI